MERCTVRLVDKGRGTATILFLVYTGLHLHRTDHLGSGTYVGYHSVVDACTWITDHL